MGKTLFELLRVRFPAQSYALFSEVQSATAHRGRQRADAVAMGLWPSRGLDVIGFEFKTHRSDWLRELKQPEKAEEIFQFCDRWYLVADGDTTKRAEIPATWGWLVPDGDGLREVVEAPKLAAKPMERLFIASLLRSAQKDRDKAIAGPRTELEHKIRVEMAEKEREHLDELAQKIQDERDKRTKMEERFEAAFGVPWNDWAAPVENVGAVVKLLATRRGDLRASLAGVKGNLRCLLADVEKAEDELVDLPTPAVVE